ncbi:adenosine deaminase [Rhodococcus jostii]|uniref:Adenosine deaminase n=2 Tax=Rhodococcus jostii TaxID=132919 RepID=A0A1H4IVE9_RHOJO|nr:adenosine deaminase [Rhodococcus jostii]
MNADKYLRSIPKVELHNHVTGAVRLQTVVEIARKNSIPLPAGDPGALYEYVDLIGFLTSHSFVCSALRDRDDFSRIAYESLEDGYQNSNVRYMEMFFNPTNHMADGVAYTEVVDGLVDGIRRAEAEFGVQGRLIPSINRQQSIAVAREMLDAIVAHRRDEVIGIGMDHDELPDPPEKFATVYQAAGRAGLKRTAHTSHDGPASHILTCLDELGCDRIDHGYRVTRDAQVLQRVVDEQIPFTCALTSAQMFWPWAAIDETPDGAVNPVKTMFDAGVNVTVHTDDPTMLHTDLGSEYIKYFRDCVLDIDSTHAAGLSALDAAWLDESDKSVLRKEFRAEMTRLGSELNAM